MNLDRGQVGELVLPLGVIKPGAYADIIIVDGNPLDDISLLADPEKNLKLIMRDGKVYKNTLQ